MYVDIKTKPLQINSSIDKSTCHNLNESQLDKPGSSYSPVPLFGSEDTTKTIHKRDSFVPPLNLSSWGEKSNKFIQSKKTGISEEKKVKILKTVVIKPEETIILKNMQTNKQFDDNAVKIDNKNNVGDGSVVIQEIPGSSMVGSDFFCLTLLISCG